MIDKIINVENGYKIRFEECTAYGSGIYVDEIYPNSFKVYIDNISSPFTLQDNFYSAKNKLIDYINFLIKVSKNDNEKILAENSLNYILKIKKEDLF